MAKEKHFYEVIVGNVGKVFQGSNYRTALAKYKYWVRLANATQGRASGEMVSLWKDNEPVKEHEPKTYPYESNPGKMIPLRGISIKGKTVNFYANPGVLKKYKKKLTALARRLVK